MKRFFRFVLVGAVAALLSACGAKDNTLPPSPLVQFTPSIKVAQLWQTQVGNGDGGYYLRLQPAASQGVIYSSSYDGLVTATNAKTGATLWQVNTRTNLTSGVAAGGGNVYVGTANAKIIALSAKNGQVVWKTSVTSQVWATPQYARGMVLVETMTGNLTALSAVNGSRIWRYDEQVPSLILHAASQPQVANNNVIAGFSDGVLGVFNIQNGNVLWRVPIALPKGSSIVEQMVDITVNPIVVDGIVYVATYQGHIAALSLDNGQVIWQHKISSFAGMTADGDRVYVTDADSRVWAFDESTGAVDWRQNNLLGRQATGPTLYNNNIVVVADRYGFMHFMSKSDGRFVGRVSTGDGALAQPLSYNGNIYVYTSGGSLLAYRQYH